MNRYDYISKFKFRVFPCKEGMKTPKINDWLKAAKYKPEISGNYGVLASGTPYKEGTIFIVDLDNHSGKSSGVEFWENNHYPEDTFTVITPSGGKHLYFVATKAQITEIENFSKHSFHESVDLFWKQNHYVMGVGSVIDGKEYQISNEKDPVKLPDIVIDLLKEKNKKSEALRPVFNQKSTVNLNMYEKELILRLAETKTEAFEPYDEWISLMAAFKNSGFDVDDFKRVSWQDEKTQKIIESKWKSINRRENSAEFGSIVYKIAPEWNNLAWRYNEVEDIAIELAAGFYTHLHKILVGKDVCIIDESSRERAIFRDYKNTYSCYQDKKHRIQFPILKGKEISLTNQDSFPIWFKNAPVLQGRVCNPDLPYGVVEIDGSKVFNDWENPILKKGTGTTALFWQHIRNNVCDGNEDCFAFFKNWIYDLISNPLHRNGIAVAISGNQGCGKSIIGNILSMCFHPKYISTINNSGQLLDKFDAGYKDTILCMLEESTFAGDRKNGVWSKMKDLITSKFTTIERKGVDTERIPNKLHFLITSNEEYVVPKQQGDRRYLVLRCNDNHRCDSEYFTKMLSNMEEGGIEKLIIEAKGHKEEAKNFNYLNIPETAIGTENMLESAPLLLRVLISKIDEYNPENGCENMPFFDVDGEILVNSSKLIECLTRKDEYMTSRKVGKQLAEWLGRSSEDRRVQTQFEGKKVIKCFAFRSIEELKRCITQQYFQGLDVFKQSL